MLNQIITFIGGGNMARSLIGGLIDTGYPVQNIWATAPNTNSLNELAKLGIHTTSDNKVGAHHADIIILAVKPQILKTVTTEIAEIVQNKNPLVISIAAGVHEVAIQAWLGGKAAIVRCMPNTPALVHSGATALYANSHVTIAQKKLAEAILRAVGITIWLPQESQLDIVTALSGSGPAYFFLVMEALEKAANNLGLAAETAHLLTVQTAFGAARMALESKQSVDELRKNVTSPGGTTESALKVLENGQLKNLFAEALQAAQERAIELAKMFNE